MAITHRQTRPLAEITENRNTTDLNAEWLESEAARKLLGVSSKAWQNYRDSASSPSPKSAARTMSTAPT